ncbi:RsfA family transcriptional regulator [Bacillus piscicola]|uniref:RsfA family transcriptional regulator n=1 Tax=Bacillus piscicola TaxID=1632684 RepID=UPI001F09EC13|nr:RsfA family transcriptional regulator [Bacillus piscicola]
MGISRQDAWSDDDDITLAEIVLRHVREGSTQLAAFEEASQKLSRTAAACGFRWNACIRKKYEAAIELARKQKEHREGESVDSKETSSPLQSVPLEPVSDTGEGKEQPPRIEEKYEVAEEIEPIHMADQLQDTVTFLKQLSRFLKDNNSKEQNEQAAKKQALQQENQALQKELTQVKKDFRRLREDYRALLDVMEKARALSEGALPYLQDENMEESG